MTKVSRREREADSRKEFGTTLRAMRRTMMLTQAELAALIGVKRGTLAQWERGDTLPQPPHMRAIVAASRLPSEFVTELQACYLDTAWDDSQEEVP